MLYKKILLLCLFLSLTACGVMSKHYGEFVPDRDAAYMDAEPLDPLVLPEGVTMDENFHSPYIIPKGTLPPEGAEPMTLVPPGGDVLLERAKAELAKEEKSEEE